MEFDSSFVIRHSSFVIRHSSFVIRHSSFVIHSVRLPFSAFCRLAFFPERAILPRLVDKINVFQGMLNRQVNLLQ